MEKKRDISDFSDHDPKKTQKAKSRRQFLKKAAYSAPAIVSLGYMIRPSSAFAGKSNTLDTDPGYGPPPDFF